MAWLVFKVGPMLTGKPYKTKQRNLQQAGNRKKEGRRTRLALLFSQLLSPNLSHWSGEDAPWFEGKARRRGGSRFKHPATDKPRSFSVAIFRFFRVACPTGIAQDTGASLAP
jgi:hypothetical protein